MTKNIEIPFALDALELTSFRLINTASIKFHPKLTVLVAQNSGGKTAVLDGISYALKAYLSASKPVFNKEDNHNQGKYLASLGCTVWAKLKLDNLGSLTNVFTDDNGMVEIGLVNNEYSAYQFLDNLSRLVKDQKFKINPNASEHVQVYTSGYSAAVKDRLHYDLMVKESQTLPLVAYFTANRRVEPVATQEFDQEFELTREAALLALLPCEDLTNFHNWLRERAINALEQRLELEELGDNSIPEPNSHLVAVSAVLAKMLSQEVNLTNVKYFARSKKILAVTDNGRNIDISQLSHGAKSILTISAELAMNCCALNPHLKEKAPAQTPGIVLIDEVDLHLHPKWQQHVLDDLQECFPLMQFIVTTHSPAVLTTVKKENIREIKVDRESGRAIVLEPISRSYGESSGDLQETIMGVSARPDNDSVRKLKAYLDWAENGDLDEDKSELLTSLKEEWGSTHADLLMAEMIIKRRQILSRNK